MVGGWWLVVGGWLLVLGGSAAAGGGRSRSHLTPSPPHTGHLNAGAVSETEKVVKQLGRYLNGLGVVPLCDQPGIRGRPGQGLRETRK